MQDYDNTDVEYDCYSTYSYIGKEVNGVSEYVSDSEYWEMLDETD